MIVLCLNDSPIGIYTTEDKAQKAALNDWKDRQPLWQKQGLTLGQSYDITGPYMRWHYYQRVFQVDAPAAL